MHLTFCDRIVNSPQLSEHTHSSNHVVHHIVSALEVIRYSGTAVMLASESIS